ncbi:MAG: hypothetical protein AB7S26_19745 [Sandaracinaceae bacterium]
MHDAWNIARSMCGLAALALAACDDGAAAEDGGGRDGGRARDGGVALDAPASDAGPRPDANLPPGSLPSGNTGIASRYPGDVGIGADDDVIFFDDFESYGSGADLDTNWNAGVYWNADIESDPTHVLAGSQSLRFTAPQQTSELSNGVARTVSPELDVLFLRWYAEFDPSFDIWGSSHNGGGISAHYFVDGNATPGIPADGMNKFLIEYECWRGEETEASPGSLNVYIYHPEQRSQWGDHFFPNGEVLPNTSIPGEFGPMFVPRTNITPELGRWYSYEVMLQANTPGMRDGRIALWLDGELIADFPNLRLRDVASLTIDRFGLNLHSGQNPSGETHKWYDNVVAARSYIGPMFGGR